MRTSALFLSLYLLTVAGCASVGSSQPEAIAAALANPARSDADRQRDARDQPLEVLKLAGFHSGMTIADIFGGGGYYSEILSTVVGPNGRVRLINNAAYDDYTKNDLATRLANHRLANVSYEIVSPADMKLGHASLDGAMIVMSYHDLYVSDPEQGWLAIDAGQFIDQIVNALKPGAVLLIVDHAASPGSGKQNTQKLHRIDEAFATADFKAHGLEWVGSINNLRNPDDDHSKNVFDPAIRGKTDRFVHAYRKPG